ncbi:hypothetical protein BGZ49_006976 [Haplosporangium sp. Z 27]|nr:hypothetical protein BGZ49_006976 [Haplosporangium sp. Z 27]
MIRKIQESFRPCRAASDSAPSISSMMPLQERPMEETVDVVARNVAAYFEYQPTRQAAKTESSFPVSSGTAGIGKTRYGQELYDALQRDLSGRSKKLGLDYSPHYHYMLLDFSRSVELSPIDSHLHADTILGLRLAFSHFFDNRYDEDFRLFCHRVSSHHELFSISSVLSAIR